PSNLISRNPPPAGIESTSFAFIGSTKAGRGAVDGFLDAFFFVSRFDLPLGLDRQILSPLDSSFMLLPESAEVSSSFLETGFISSPALIKSHCFWSLSRTKYHSPLSLEPFSTK